jgi:hypothetical protein
MFELLNPALPPEHQYSAAWQTWLIERFKRSELVNRFWQKLARNVPYTPYFQDEDDYRFFSRRHPSHNQTYVGTLFWWDMIVTKECRFV